jgi:hypothetical protein
MWHYNYGPYLQHYASKYYDPVKAHEYYEKHKQLKGNKPKVTLNEEGRSVDATVKENINKEKEERLTQEEERYKKEQEIRSDAKKRTMEQHKVIMNQRITSLQNLIKRMPKDRLQAEAPKIRAAIQKLRDDNDKKRQSIEEKYHGESKAAQQKTSDTKKAIRDEAKSTYESEHNKILSEAKYQQAKKGGKKGTAKSAKFTD